MKLSIIIPVYNEEKTFTTLLTKVNSVSIPNIEKEIVIVDDFSRDKTRTILKNLVQNNLRVIYHKANQGKGAAIRTGLKYITGDLVVIQDADLEYNPEEYKELIKPILKNEYSVVYGSRFFGKQTGCYIWSHHFGNKILSLTTSILYGCKITDMETCYKMMKTEIIKSLKLKAKRFDFEPEITAKLIKAKYKIKEVPISYNCRSFSEGKKITWRDGMKALYYLLKYRFLD